MDKVIATGTLKILDREIPCAILEGEKRVLVQRELLGLLTGNIKGGLGRYLAPANLQPFVPEKFKDIPLDRATYTFRIGNKKIAQGFEAEDIINICDMYLKARNAKVLLPNQAHLAVQSEMIMRSFAKVGLVALIDEATGYQQLRKKDALRILVEQYIIAEARQWTKEFYDEFFIELDRIYKNKPTISRNRPKYYGKFINKYVYGPIENGAILPELKKLKGAKSNRLHQFLNDERGLRVLRDRIGKITVLLQISNDKSKFESAYGRMESKQMWFNFEDSN